MEENTMFETGTVNIGAVYNEPNGRKGVVLLADRRVTMGSFGFELPSSYKLGAITPEMSMTIAGTAGDGQWLRETLQSIERDTEDLYYKAAEHFKEPPTISEPEMKEINQKLFSEDIISGKAKQISNKAKQMSELQRQFDSAYALSNAAPEDKEKRQHADMLAVKIGVFQREMGTFGQEYDNDKHVEFLEMLKKKKKEADAFFVPDEFQLEVYTDKRGNRYARRALPVERTSWSGEKVFSSVGVAFQRLKSKDGKTENVFPTVDSTAKLLGVILQGKMKTMSYHGLLGGVNPYDGARLYEIDSAGAVTETKTWTATGSGSSHNRTSMEKKSQDFIKEKGYMTREDAIELALDGAIPVATGMDAYVGPPLDVVVIEQNGEGKIVSYKTTVDLSKDKKCVVMPEKGLQMEVLAREGKNNVFYQATADAHSTMVHKMPDAGKYGELTKIDNPELAGSIKDIANSCLKVMEKYSVG